MISEEERVTKLVKRVESNNEDLEKLLKEIASREEKDKKKLRSGDFSAGINVDQWFGCYMYDYIKAAIKGCDKTFDLELFSHILMYALYYMKHPNGDVNDRKKLVKIIKESGEYPVMERMSRDELVEYWNERIVEECEEVVRKATIVGSHHYGVYGPVLEKLYSHKNARVRLYCAANLNYFAFTNDTNERVAKVANIRKKFEHDFALSTEKERKFIEFLVSAIDNDVIQCIDGCVGGYAEDCMMVSFQSHLFTRTGWIDFFDKDIFENISDKRVLASAIYRLIGEGKIVLNTEMLPPIFEVEDRKKMIKDRKAEGYKFFN